MADKGTKKVGGRQMAGREEEREKQTGGGQTVGAEDEPEDTTTMTMMTKENRQTDETDKDEQRRKCATPSVAKIQEKKRQEQRGEGGN